MMYYSDVVTKNMQFIDGFSHICISTDNVDVFQTGYIA